MEVAETEMSISMRELKRLRLEWGKEVRFDSYQGKERIGSFSVELIAARRSRDSLHWVRILIRYIYGGRFLRPIEIESTACNFGGSRDWFVCPGCGRHCAALYIRRLIRCRICHGLAYLSQTEHDVERRLRRIGKRRERLGGSRSILADFPPKPKRMRRKTYERLLKQDAYEVDRHYRKGLAGFDAIGGGFPVNQSTPIPSFEPTPAPALDYSTIARRDREAMEWLRANSDSAQRMIRELAENAQTEPSAQLQQRRKSK